MADVMARAVPNYNAPICCLLSISGRALTMAGMNAAADAMLILASDFCAFVTLACHAILRICLSVDLGSRLHRIRFLSGVSVSSPLRLRYNFGISMATSEVYP